MHVWCGQKEVVVIDVVVGGVFIDFSEVFFLFLLLSLLLLKVVLFLFLLFMLLEVMLLLLLEVMLFCCYQFSISSRGCFAFWSHRVIGGKGG